MASVTIKPERSSPVWPRRAVQRLLDQRKVPGSRDTCRGITWNSQAPRDWVRRLVLEEWPIQRNGLFEMESKPGV